ncbi:hypothetical protein J437_LFUL014097 [Ladona fulva]|uniref:Uncharacterized protein n=1 Tax=Ladona fulva TaxID=123851 RepID=A0A8K0KJ25_LADFU|nr:hypothetical protein J437_LFUL014097 [Ladona fulva]
MDYGYQVDPVFLDLTKAFGRVNHKSHLNIVIVIEAMEDIIVQAAASGWQRMPLPLMGSTNYAARNCDFRCLVCILSDEIDSMKT